MYSFQSFLEIEVKIDVHHYVPERLYPECRNPSSPIFADDGDKEEIEYDAFFLIGDDNTEIPIPEKLLDFFADDIKNDIRGEKNHE